VAALDSAWRPAARQLRHPGRGLAASVAAAVQEERERLAVEPGKLLKLGRIDAISANTWYNIYDF
jgi:hypothetical protein